MRYLALGDIHGCYNALVTLSSFVPFRSSDLLITLGDYVDHGPNSYAVLDWLIRYKRRGRLVALRGNHDVMMVRAREDRDAYIRWVADGGDKTLGSYSPFGDAGKLVDVPDEHWHFLEEETVRYFETESHFFVHANVFPDVPLDEQPDFMLFWHKFGDPAPHESGLTMISGHSPQKSGLPAHLGHAICLDTWAYGDGWLSCLDVESGRLYQANERGEARSLAIGDFAIRGRV